MSSELPIVDNNPDEFICVRCARHMQTCCQTSEVYATPVDARRIAEFTGMDRTEFTEFRAPEDPVYLKQDDDPIWVQLVFKDAAGTRRVLKRRPNGDCVFLGTAGCVLPLETRPLICRLYPFHFNEQGILPTLAEGCPRELLAPGQELLSALDMHLADAQRWHADLYRDLREELTADDYRADLRS